MRDKVNITDTRVQQLGSLRRMSVSVQTVLSTVQEHEEGICSGHIHRQGKDFPCRNNLTKLQRHLREVRATLPSGKRHHILVRTGTFQTGLRRGGPKRTRPGTDRPGTSLEPCPL